MSTAFLIFFSEGIEIVRNSINSIILEKRQGFLFPAFPVLCYFLDVIYKSLNLLTYSPALKGGDSDINKDCASHDGLISSTPMVDAPTMSI